MNLQSLIREIPDYPKPGIIFRDILPILYNPKALKYVNDKFYMRYHSHQLDGVAGIEARGFIFGVLLAQKLGVSFIPIRKPGKLPCDVISADYSLEYGTDTLEIDKTAINKGDNILIVDDLIATGGTAVAAGDLIESLGGHILEYAFLIDLYEIGGSSILRFEKHRDVFSLLTLDGD